MTSNERTSQTPGVSPARHAARAVTSTWWLALKLALKPQYLLNLPSNYAWMVMRRKYDAFTTDRAYDERPSSWLGPLGWWADRRVLNFPLHVSLRHRLRFVTESLVEQITGRRERGVRPVRVLSAPSGLCRDLIQTADELRRRDPSLLEQVEFHVLDIDFQGDVIPEARRRMEAAAVPVTFYREDIFDPTGLTARSRAGMKFQVVNCIGLTAWLTLEEIEKLVGFFRQVVMEPGSILLIDNFAWHQHSAMGEDLEIYTSYHPPEAFAQVITRAGFEPVEEKATPSGVNTLSIVRAK
ncbi:MAG: hypothetical protein ACE5IZ_01265 [Dehalococcoidia bacterium]